MRNVKALPVDQRPREKLLKLGPDHLSDLELLAVMIGRGVKGAPVLDLSAQVLRLYDGRSNQVGLDALRGLRGLGAAKAAQICAAVEFARRRISPRGFRIEHPLEVLPLIRNFADRRREHILAVSLNGGGEVLDIKVVAVGMPDEGALNPAAVFAEALVHRAAALILAHNHPRGLPVPTSEDFAATRRIRQAAEVLSIRFIDHIIFNSEKHFSFASEGLL